MYSLKVLGQKLSVFAKATNFAQKFLIDRNFFTIVGISLLNSNAFQSVPPNPILKSNLNLIPTATSVVPRCGLKVRGKPKLRCKHCYYAGIDGVLHVFCDAYGRHKQRAFTKRKFKYNLILTHASMSKYRPY